MKVHDLAIRYRFQENSFDFLVNLLLSHFIIHKVSESFIFMFFAILLYQKPYYHVIFHKVFS